MGKTTEKPFYVALISLSGRRGKSVAAALKAYIGSNRTLIDDKCTAHELLLQVQEGPWNGGGMIETFSADEARVLDQAVSSYAGSHPHDRIARKIKSEVRCYTHTAYCKSA